MKTPFPLHPAQQDVYTDQFINVESPHYNIGGYIILKGHVDKAKFHQAISTGPTVFDAFKMRFDPNGDDAVFFIDNNFENCALAELDFSGEINAVAEVNAWMQKRFNTPFAIEKDALLFEHVLIQLSKSEHWYFCRCHHLITDGYGFTVWVQYVAGKYQSLLAGTNTAFSYPQYAEESGKAIAYKSADEYESDGNYWKEKIRQKPENLLTKKYPELDNLGNESSTFILPLNDSQRKWLDDLQLSAKCSLQQLTIAALLIYFAKTTEQSEFIFGVPVHKRNSKRLRSVIGMFSGILPFKGSFKKEATVADLLKDISATQRSDYRHQHYLIGDLAKHLKINAYEGYLCEVIINYEPLFFDLSFGEAIQATIYRLANEFDRNPLQLSWRDYAALQPLQLHIHYRNEYFNADEVALLAQRVLFILEQFAGKMEDRIENIDILPNTEQALLHSFNTTHKDYPKDRSIVELFEEQALHTPDAVALVFEQYQLTYKQLNERANQLAHYLHSKGVKPEMLIPVCIERSLELIVAILGILKSGAAYVPVNPAYPAERISYMLQDISAILLITSKAVRGNLPPLDEIEIIEADNEAMLQEQPSANLQTIIKPNNLAYVIYTSGSTGRPKGVLVEHGNVVSLVREAGYVTFSTADILLSTGSPSFDATTFEYWGVLLNGGQLILATENSLLNSESLKAVITERTVTKMWFTASWFNQLADTDITIFEGLQTILVGGEKLSVLHINKVKHQYPLLQIINGYGPTENTTFSITHDINKVESGADIPIGRPLNNRTAFVLNDGQELVPVGITGEICLGGAGLARGYLNQPALTAEKFIIKQFSNGQEIRLYKTGDLGRVLPDGTIQYAGRKDEQVKIRGHRIELGEIETVLQQSGSIQQSVVVVNENADGIKRLAGYVVAIDFDKDAIVAYLKMKLPEYMVPMLWIRLNQLPLTANGKVNKEALPEPDAAEQLSNAYTAPRNEAETTLSGIWEELLHSEKVGIHDNFFELGGDSIIAIQLVSRAKRSGLIFQPKDIFIHQTIANLCKNITSDKANPTLAEQGILSGSAGLLPIQQCYFDKQPENVSVFSQKLLLKIDRKITPAILQQALTLLTEHHDVLRFQYTKKDDTWLQEYGQAAVQMRSEDLQSVPTHLLQSEISERVEKCQRNLDIERGKLVQVAWMNMPDAEMQNRLFIVIHHLAIDGVSWRILLEDLELLLSNLVKGTNTNLSTKTSSYRQWCLALKEYSQSKKLLSQKSYWEGIVKQNELPAATKNDGVVNTNNTGTHTIRLGAAQTKLLLQEVPGIYHTTINDILLCALAITLGEHTNKDTVTIGLEAHGREHIADKMDTSRTVGWFTSLYPVLLQSEVNSGLDGWIKTIKEQLHQVPDNGLGYGVLKYMNKEASLQSTDPWSITFNYLGQLDNAMSLNGALQIADEVSLTDSDGSQSLSAHLSIESYVLGGELVGQWNYNTNYYTENVIGKLSAAYITNLQKLIDHCMEQAKIGVVFTPADYGLNPEISYATLDNFLDESFRGKQRKDFVETMYRLSGLQQGMLFHALYSSTSGAYISQFTCDLYDVDIALFRKSWEAVLQSHSILRSCFYADELSIPVQCVYRTIEIAINELNCQHLQAAQQQQAIAEYIKDDSRKGFDFKQGPLTRFTLIQLGNDRFKMLWSTHHILFDGWSLPVLMGEFLHNYELLATGKTLPQKWEDKYEDFIRYVSRIDKEKQENYWRNYLKDVEQSTLLPFIKNESGRTRGVGQYAEVFIKPAAELQAAIQAYAQKARITVNTMMQGVWAYLLSQYTRSQHVLYAVTVSGRPDDLPNVENRVGMYINTLPLHSHIQDGQKVVEWLQQMQDEQLASRAYQHTPINDIQHWSGIQGDLFDSLLVFLNYPIGKMLSSKQWLLQPDNVHMYEQNNFPLTITITNQEVISIAFSYNTSLLKEAYIHQIKNHFEHVLTQMIYEPDALLNKIKILSPAEQKQLLIEFNPSITTGIKDKNIIAIFEEHAKNNTKAVALIYENQQLTFGELNRRANHVAHYLHSRGIRADTFVPVCMEPSPEMIVAILGILKAGATYVPIDPAYPPKRISYLLEDIKATFLLTNNVSNHLLKNSFDIEIIEINNSPEIENQSSENLSTPIKQEHVAYVIYTSGSTGKPKGVMVAHGSLSNYLFNGATNYIDKDKKNQSGTFAHLAYTFDASLTSIFMPLLAGKRIVIGSKAHTNIFDDPNLWKYAPYDFIKLTPAHLQLLQHTADEVAHNWLTNKLVLGGEALHLNQFDYYIQHGINAEIINEYGPTEATVGCSTFSFHLSGNNDEIKDFIPIGKPIENTSLYILGSNRELLATGITGEMYIGGAGLAKGYLNQPELTVEKFIQNPFDESGLSKLYRTGDLGYWLPDGNMAFTGRADEQVKIRGYRIELGEIESVLQQYEQLDSAVVLATEDATGNKRLVAYVVAKNGFDKQLITAYLESKLPSYMVPDVWVELESLPLTTNGKIDKKALPNPEIHAGAEDAAPRNEQEEKLATIWQELLELDQVSIHDDFFDIGGHSLLAIRVISAIRRELGVELTINNIFDYPTIQLLAEKIQGQSTTDLLPAVVAGKRPLHIPLSYSQERLWFIDQLEGSVPYHIAAALRLTGVLNTAALEHALKEIVNRHEILRTIYGEENGQVYQQIKSTNTWALRTTDGTLFTTDEKLQQYIKEIAHRPFNLSKDDMLRVELITLAAEEYILVVTMHHIASDAWSMPILVSEFAALYNAYNQGASPQLPAPQLQFADYAIWQRAWLQGETLAIKLQYWKEKLDGVLPLQLPTDYTRPAVSSTKGASASFHISPELKTTLLQISQQNGATLYMTLLAAFNVLLYRYSAQEDVCVGTSIAGRPQRELEDLIGFFVNTLALRSQVNGKMKFTELLQQVRTTMLEAYAHQEVPFEKVVEAVVKDRDANRSPLFQVMLVLRNTPDVPELQLGNLIITTEPYEFTTVKFDLTFFLTEAGAGLEGSVLYSTDLFGKKRIERMIAHFITLLNSVVAAAGNEVSSLQMLSEAEENSSRQGFNVSSIQNMEDKTVVALFEKQAQLWPASAAVSFEGNEISYAELNERSNRLAHYLRYCGVTTNTLVPLFADRSPDMIIGILGILKAGGAYVPIDVSLPQERISFMLQDTTATVMVCSAESRDKLSAFDEIDIIEINGTLVTNQPKHNLNTGLTAQSLAYLIYTSGSTGQPKGVMVTHSNLTDYVQGLDERTGINSCNSFALVSTIATDLGNTVLYASLVSGGTLHVFSREAVSNIEYLHEYFKEHDIDCIKVVPSHWKALIMDGQPLLPRRLLVFGGESLQAEQVALIKNSKRRKCRIINHYGPTETTVGKLLYEVDFSKEYAGTIPIGKPFGDSRIYVLSSDGALCPVGVPGQLYIGGAGVAKGYLNNEQLTREKFIADPFNTEAGLVYKTSDLVQYDADGNIVFLGRIDDQVKIRGYRVEPGEVERVITASGQVAQVVVLATDDKQQNKRLVAYVAATDFDREALNSYLKEKLPDYMIPSVIVALERLPLTSNGKIDRKQLPDPDSITAPTSTAETAATETEAKLAAIWKEILEVDEIGIHDDFFELGGHSLLAVRLISAIRKAFSVEMPIGHVFDYPTVSLLAAQLPATDSSITLPVVEVIHPRPARIPLSFSQERLWFIDRLEGSIQYHVPAVVRLRGHLNTIALGKSLQQIIHRHEVLRTVIRSDEGTPYQFVRAADDWRLELVDGKAYASDNNALQAYVETLLNEPFDLSKDYMMRAHLIGFAADDNLLVLTLHHVASDGWSRSVLVRELVELYSAYEQNRQPDLKELPVQFADYTIWQRNYLQGDVLDKKLSYWKQKLEGSTVLELPTDYVRPAVWKSKGALLNFTIDKELANHIQQLSQQNGTTLYMTLLAAFNVLLYRYSGQQDICVGTGIAGRQQQELDGLIGFFVNTLVMRSQLDGEASFTSLLQQVKTTTLEAYEHQEMSFEKVVDAVVTERDMSRNPLFQVSFVVQNTPDVPELRLGNAVITIDDHDHLTSKFDITFSITENENGLGGVIEYSTYLYSEATIRRMSNHFTELLRSIIQQPDEKISRLQLLSPVEEQSLISGINTPVANYPTNKSIIDLFEQQVIKTPDAVALVFNEEQVSYSELNSKADKIARHLQHHGVKAATLVPICVERGINMVVGILAILKAGGAYVPVDPEYPEERISFILEDTSARLIVTSPESRVKLTHKSNLEIIELSDDYFNSGDDLTSTQLDKITPHQLAYIIYTSGSTGKPKGVMIEHGSVVNLIHAQAAYFNIDNNERILQFSNYCFDASVEQVFLALFNGATLVLYPEGLQYNTALFETYLQEHKITHLHATPFFLENINPQHTGTLKRVIAGGDTCRKELSQKWKKQVAFYNEYGPTETTVTAIEYHDESGNDYNTVPIGKPLNNVSVYILDKNNALCPAGIPGELHIGGVQVARGYLNQPELTEEKFIPDTFTNKPGARLYKTGDQARWLSDGNLEFLGRIDDQVKLRGYRIELGEVESVLNELESVENSCVVVKQDAEATRLVAYYVPKQEVIWQKEQVLYNQQINGWKEIHENEYVLADTEIADPEFNILGWNDSFTRNPIPATHMREWLDDITAVIMSQHPQHVLEIGCGTGLIYYQLAGKVKKYIGTDFSQNSINQISRRISEGHRNYGPTELQVSAAHEITLNENEPVDTIILNSVVQYFPGADYLSTVIEKSIQLLKGKGCIIIGDVRDNRLLQLFKNRLYVQKLPGSISLKDFNWAVNQELLKEEELCFSPAYFYQLQNKYPDITNVEIRWKNGSHSNELTMYRFTVIIHVGIEKKVLQPQWQQWKGVEMITDITQQLTAQTEIIALTNVPNPRLWKDRLMQETLQQSASSFNNAALEMQEQDDETEGIQQLLNTAELSGYHYRLVPNEDPLQVNVLFERNLADCFIKHKWKESSDGNYTNIPLFNDISLLLQKEIRLSLLQKLPEYMVPSELTALMNLPATSNGKLDRQFLSRVENSAIANENNYEPPRNATEHQLAKIWQELLHIERAGIHNNFFELGGHSLMGMRVIAAIRKEMNMEVGIKDLFLHPTIAELAGHLLSLRKGVLLPHVEKQLRPDRIPLSFGQERLWFIDKLAGSVQYHLPFTIRLKGKVDKAALQHTLQQIIQRHEALRTTIHEADGQGYQFILNSDNWQLVITDGAVHQDKEALNFYIQQLIDKPFDLSKEYMLRAHLIALSPEDYLLVIIMHHIAADAWSMPIFIHEVAALYSAVVGQKPVVLRPLPIQYADYAIWQRTYLQGEVLNSKIRYWKDTLTGVAPLQLPVDFVRPAVWSTRGSVTRFSLDAKLSAVLKSFSQQQECTLFMTLLATFNVLLHRYSNQEDICVGTSVANRNQKETEDLIGFFVNILALRSNVTGELPFTELLQQVKTTTLQAYECGDVPFEKVVDAVVDERDMSKNPLVQVMLILLNTPKTPELQLQEVVLSLQESEQTKTLFDISFYISETDSGLQGWVVYATDLYTERTVTQMIGNYVELISNLIAHPAQQVGTVSLLSVAEKQKLLIDFNGAQQPVGIHQTIIQVFEHQVTQSPDAVAIVFGQLQLTYNELNEKSNQLAHYLKSKHVTTGTLVPICTDRSPEMMIGILGILKAGGAYVPVNAQYPAERIQFMLNDISAGLILCDSSSEAKLPYQINPEVILLDGNAFTGQPVYNLHPVVQPESLAYVMYTSGSTGKPKGVLVEHKSVVNLITGIHSLTLSNQDVLLPTGSPSFDATTFEYWSMLLNGGKLVLCTEEQLLNIDLLKKEIQNKQVTKMWFTSSWFNKLVDADSSVFETLDTILVGGEKLSEPHILQLRNTYPGLKIINGYGPTENTTFSLTYAITETVFNKAVPVGCPLHSRRVYILDTNGNPVPMGVTGEICVAGAGLARGYLNNEELTNQKFVPDIISGRPGEKMYKTGDLGYWLPDGNIAYKGRLDDQVKIRGYRIELGEIENALAQNEAVKQCVVVSNEDEPGRKRLVAYVVPVQAFDKENLIAYLKEKLPEYMVPALWVVMEHLPLTANGKVDKNALPRPDMAAAVSHEYEGPRTELEKTFVQLWQDLLDIEKVGIRDNFFELGGDSILAIQMVSRARQTGHEIKVADVFTYQTIAQLSEMLVHGANKSSVVMEEQSLLTGPAGLLPIQQWYFEKESPDASHFNQSVLLKLNKVITVADIQIAVQQLIAHHDALRFRYYKKDGVWQQEYGTAIGEVHIENLEETNGSLSDLITAQADKHQRSLHIENGEMLRVVFMQTPQADAYNRLFIVIHHLVVDGVSWRILLEDLAVLLDGKSKLENKTSSFRQWYSDLEYYGKSQAIAAQINYWKQVVNSYSPLSTDFNFTEPVTVQDTALCTVKLGTGQTQALLQEVPRVYHTEINDILLSALAQTLCSINAGNKIVIGLEGHGREPISDDVDITRTVGWFTSLYPVLLQATDKGVDSLIKGVKEQLRQVPDKGLGFGVLKYLNKMEALQGAAHWDVVFNYLGQLDNITSEGKWFTIANEPTGAGRSEQQIVHEKLSVTCYVRSGVLVVNWSYSTRHFKEETISKLAIDYLHQLQMIIAHCIQQAKNGTVYTPSDYGLGKDVSFEELDEFLEEENSDNILSF